MFILSFLLKSFGQPVADACTAVKTCNQFEIDVSELASWNFVGNTNGGKSSWCQCYHIVGGFKTLGSGGILSKSFYDLPKHDTVKIKFFFFSLGTLNNLKYI